MCVDVDDAKSFLSSHCGGGGWWRFHTAARNNVVVGLLGKNEKSEATIVDNSTIRCDRQCRNDGDNDDDDDVDGIVQ